MNNKFSSHFSPAAQDKLQLAHYFIKCYQASRQGLQLLGILRSERSLQSDYAEWLASQMYQLRLSPNPVQKGFDATDSDGYTYQIKSRLINKLRDNTSFDMKPGTEFDYLLGMFFSPDFDLLAVIRVPYAVVLELGNLTQNTFRFRWNRQTADDARVEKLLWPEP